MTGVQTCALPIYLREVGSVSGLTRLLLLLGDAAVLMVASVFGRRERWAGWIGFKGVLGRSMASGRLRDDDKGGAWLVCETCDARGEVIELGCVEGAVMLRDDECARTAPTPSSSLLGRDAQQP